MDIKLMVYRMDSPFPDPVSDLEHHQERARLVHGLAEALDLQIPDWGVLDTPEPHELAEIIAACGTAGVFTALVRVCQTWIEREKIKDVDISIPGNGLLKARGATAKDIEHIIQAMKLPP